MKKILVIAGGGKKHLRKFKEEGDKMGLDVTLASFSDLEYRLEEEDVRVSVAGENLEGFAVIYIRLSGKRLEETALLVDFAREKGIKIVDRIYEKSRFIRLPLPKSVEMKILAQAGIPLPKSFFAKISRIADVGPEIFGFPFVIKSTSGKQGHGVWSPRDQKQLDEIAEDLKKQEREGKKFVAQEFIEASQRLRVLVVGGACVAGITRPTKWRKRFIDKVDGQYPEGKREQVNLTSEDRSLALKAAECLGIDIAGVDIIRDDSTNKPYVLEVNAAPRWAAIQKDSGINVEKEILRFISSGI